ncbi:MAG TPA: 1,4-alpha-glucan branching protein GlgB [Bacteroidales bacterium]|nr:1,4-alpha-glucan branching protein GlgB [Bacteroidales bacterium]
MVEHKKSTTEKNKANTRKPASTARTVGTKGQAGKKPVKKTPPKAPRQQAPEPPEPAGKRPPEKVWYDTLFISDFDIYLFREGNHYSLYDKMGAHRFTAKGVSGVHFAVWAPNASKVSVIGNFNFWDPEEHPLKFREDGSGIWEGFIPDLQPGEVYKYHIVSTVDNYQVEKADPYARYAEHPPKTGSVIWEDSYTWEDADWLAKRIEKNALDAPMSVYELHLESWRLVPEEGNRPLTYREMAHALADYIKDMGYTHVELLPVMEYPFSGSWGYQVLGFFAPTSRFGNPDDFRYFVDYLHQQDIGVILDWVPSHFPGDLHGLHFFDGTFLFEHQDPRQGYHPDWSSYIFNYGRNEIKEFLISSAHFWLEQFHIDGLRVDAVASMLYLDYSRKEGEWVPNKYGGRENLDAIDFLRDLNESVYSKFPGVQTIAEESTSWPMVTRPAYTGGLGFGLKWNMGWMHDTLDFFSKDPVFRSYHHNMITFSIWYAFSENFMLSISHDEVVHGKGSLMNKMPGDNWQKFANMRLLFGYMFSHPGKKLMFMGSEIGQWNEWNHESSVEWNLLEYDTHRGLQRWIRDLNTIYRARPAFYENDFRDDGFKWIDANDSKNSILSYVRYDKSRQNPIIIICNFTPVPHLNYRVGLPEEGFWKEILNSDAELYGGSGYGNFGGFEAVPVPYHQEQYSINVTLPPLGIVMFTKEE